MRATRPGASRHRPGPPLRLPLPTEGFDRWLRAVLGEGAYQHYVGPPLEDARDE